MGKIWRKHVKTQQICPVLVICIGAIPDRREVFLNWKPFLAVKYCQDVMYRFNLKKYNCNIE